jgi:cytochrome c oxidase assembly protein subunit 11
MGVGRCGRGDISDCHFEIPSTVSAEASTELQQSNRRMGFRLLLVAIAFGGFGFAMVPLYDVICRLTGLNGRTNATAIAQDKNTQVDMTRSVNVEFLSHTMPGVGLEFKAEQFTMRVHPGEIMHTTYTVKNTSSEVFVGQAVPSVTPAVAAPYLQKIECFCFSQQTFQPGEVRTMPVVFVINPDMSRDLGTVTLSYTFFEAPKARI